ncbi:MAG: hypothetical protein Q9167_006214 [Letrouitia subvulpina]
MAKNPGEERLLTVYADVHYYFSAPTPRPLSHRFDKGSYLYLYRNVSGRGGRLEIANNVGKPEQDAFTGSLDSTKISQSHKHLTLSTVTVDGYEGRSAPSPPPQHPEHHWRLPNTDPRNEGKYLFRLHTVDIYFWKVVDATSFMDAVEKMLDHEQVEILDRPPAVASHEQVMSPVVQKLEKVAIQDPVYRNGQPPESGTGSTSVIPSPAMGNDTGSNAPKAEDPEAYKPLAYNPAAPAAPEPIKHREKTPPPPDAISEGTGLSSTAYNDHMQQMSPPLQQRQGSSLKPPYQSPPYPRDYGVQPTNQSQATTYQSPQAFSSLSGRSPAPGGGTSKPSFLPPPPPQNDRTPSATSSTQNPGMAFSPPPRDPNAHSHTGGHNPLDSPSAQVLGNSYIGSPSQPLQHLQPQYADYLASRPQQQHPQQPPIGGYSDYSYAQSHNPHGNYQGSGYDVHSQAYRPTEEEANKHKHHKASEAAQPSGKLEQQASKLDKGVNRFFKKLEKKIG